MNIKQISEILKQTRRQKGLTRQKLSELSGVSIGTIQSYERGKKVMNIQIIGLLFTAMGYNVQFIMEPAGG